MNNLAWKPLQAEDYARIPDPIKAWLIDTGSLTTRLRGLCDQFSVKLLAQRERQATAPEITRLGLDAHGSLSLIEREVQLLCNQQPVIYARSLIPVAALVERFADLDKLGTRPLGEKIFADPELQRSQIEWAIMDASHPCYPTAISGLEEAPAGIFGRRSLFHGAPKPILIGEFFLPGIEKL